MGICVFLLCVCVCVQLARIRLSNAYNFCRSARMKCFTLLREIRSVSVTNTSSFFRMPFNACIFLLQISRRFISNLNRAMCAFYTKLNMLFPSVFFSLHNRFYYVESSCAKTILIYDLYAYYFEHFSFKSFLLCSVTRANKRQTDGFQFSRTLIYVSRELNALCRKTQNDRW